MERAVWVDWRRDTAVPAWADRVYLGHETCDLLLPDADRLRWVLRALARRGLAATLVTPLLTPALLARAANLARVAVAAGREVEVVCSDWGLLRLLGREGLCPLSLGRLLTAVPSDPRYHRMLDGADRPDREVTHLDGTRCLLRRCPPSPELRQHLRSCWLADPVVLRFLRTLGVERAEVSRVPQGLDLPAEPGWAWSLHVDEVLLTVMRPCRGAGGDLARAVACPCSGRGERVEPWSQADLGVPVFRRDNALYYEANGVPGGTCGVPAQRLVYRRTEVGQPSELRTSSGPGRRR